MSDTSQEEIIAAATEVRIYAAMIHKLAIRDLEQCLTAQGADLNALQFGVLNMLSHHSQTISDLSKKMTFSPATLVPVVDVLEQKGYARRAQDPNDRRRTPLELTEKGVMFLRQLHLSHEKHSVLEGILKMGEAKARELLALMRELVSHMSGDADLTKHIAESVRQHSSRMSKPYEEEKQMPQIRRGRTYRPQRTRRRPQDR